MWFNTNYNMINFHKLVKDDTPNRPLGYAACSKRIVPQWNSTSTTKSELPDYATLCAKCQEKV
jgi:hypothetical protein